MVSCDDLEGGRGLKREWIYTYRSLIHFAGQQKLTQHIKPNTPIKFVKELKMFKKKRQIGLGSHYTGRFVK